MSGWCSVLDLHSIVTATAVRSMVVILLLVRCCSNPAVCCVGGGGALYLVTGFVILSNLSVVLAWRK